MPYMLETLVMYNTLGEYGGFLQGILTFDSTSDVYKNVTLGNQ